MKRWYLTHRLSWLYFIGLHYCVYHSISSVGRPMSIFVMEILQVQSEAVYFVLNQAV